jgi:hypothetical protein
VVCNLHQAIDKALEEGLTINEIKEALSQLYAYTGFRFMYTSLTIHESYTLDSCIIRLRYMNRHPSIHVS